MGANSATGIYSTNSGGNNTIGGGNDSGNITFIADTLDFSTGNTPIQTTATVTFKPYTANTTIGVDGGSGTLQITSGMLGNIHSGAAGITIGGGSGHSGNINVVDYAFNAPVIYANGNGSVIITNSGSMNEGFAITTTGSGMLYEKAVSNIIVGHTITATGNGGITLDANDTSSGSGYIDVAAAVTTNGDNIAMGGGNGAIMGVVLNANGTVNTAASGYAIGNAGQVRGVYINNATLNANGTGVGGNITINGEGYNTSGNNNYGVFVNGGNITTNNSGVIALSGLGEGTGNSNNDYGVHVAVGAVISTVNGNLVHHRTGGGAGSVGSNNGVAVAGTGQIKTTGSGNIIINGTAGAR